MNRLPRPPTRDPRRRIASNRCACRHFQKLLTFRFLASFLYFHAEYFPHLLRSIEMNDGAGKVCQSLKAQHRERREEGREFWNHQSPVTVFPARMESIRIMDGPSEVDIHVECALECFSQRPIPGWASPDEAICAVRNAPDSTRRLSSWRSTLVAKRCRRFGSQDGFAP